MIGTRQRDAALLALAILAGCTDAVRLGAYGDETLPGPGDGGAGGGGASRLDAASGADGGVSPLACTSTRLDCNGVAADGCETDITTSGLHCGRCGHSCLGGACADGRCQPATLASGLVGPEWIDVGPDYVVWTTSGHAGVPGDANELFVSAKDGSNRVLVKSEQGIYRAVAADGDAFYSSRFIADQGVTLAGRAPSSGASIGLVAGGFLDGSGLAFDETSLFLAGTTTLYRMPKTVGVNSMTPLTPGFTKAIAIAVDGSGIYVADSGASQVIGLDKATGVVRWRSSSTGPATEVSLDATHVYFAANQRAGRIAKDGTGLDVFATGITGAAGIRSDGSSAFITTKTEVVRADLSAPAGTGRVVLASGFTSLGRLAMDATALYFTDTGAGVVYRLAK